MLNHRLYIGYAGNTLLLLGIFLLIPMIVGALMGDDKAGNFGVTALVGIALGAATWNVGRDNPVVRLKDGFITLSLCWFLVILMGTLPYMMSGLLSFHDAFFESASGFTTTGASVFNGQNSPKVEEIGVSFIFWRAFSQWLGGLAFVVLALSFLPALGVGEEGAKLKMSGFGLSFDRISHRLKTVLKTVLPLYILLTVIMVMLLLPEMTLFEATCQAFSTLSSGGFNFKNEGIAAFQSWYIEWVVAVFMMISGINLFIFSRIFRVENWGEFNDERLKTYLGLTVLITLLITVLMWKPTAFHLSNLVKYNLYKGEGLFLGFEPALRNAFFHVASFMSTTGYSTANYMQWMPFPIGLLLVAAWTSGMAGSASGGIKIMRHILLFKYSIYELRQTLHPNAILPIRLNKAQIAPEVMRGVLGFIIMYLGVFVVGMMGMMFFAGTDLISSVGATLAALNNLGTGFGQFYNNMTYGDLPVLAKWWLSFLMIVGRLEVFPVLVLFVRGFWTR